MLVYSRSLGVAALLLSAAASTASAAYLNSDGHDANGYPMPRYRPGRPPSLPLAVRSPYLSAWSTTASSATLNSGGGGAAFWTGTALGWEGLVVVDGVAYEYLGTGAVSQLQQPSGGPQPVRAAQPLAVAYDAHYSNFSFAAGPVAITASFFSPVTPRDLCRAAIPMSYLTTTVQARDNASHTVRFYSDVDDAWARRQQAAPLVWHLAQDAATGNGTGGGNGTTATNADALPLSWIVRQSQPNVLAENEDMADWGTFTYSTAACGAALSYANGDPARLRHAFVTEGRLGNTVDEDFDAYADRVAVFAFAHDAGTVRRASVRYTIGSMQTPAAQYLHVGGLAELRPWWQQCYGVLGGTSSDGDDEAMQNISALIRFHWHDFGTVTQLAAAFEAKLQADVQAFAVTVDGGGTSGAGNGNGSAVVFWFDPGSAYGFLSASDNSTGLAVPGIAEADAHYAIVALSARQTMAAYVFVAPPAGAAGTEEPLLLQKEISSDGNVNTVDVVYPAAPFLLWANPALLRLVLEPAYAMQEAGLYPNAYCAHDVGAHFPNATGHVDGGDEAMPVEESGNFVLLSYAYYVFAAAEEQPGDGPAAAAWLACHYPLLRQFAQYLERYTLVPAAQLSTDDFAGRLANQTNLALKGILGLRAMAAVARVAGAADDAAHFEKLAHSYYAAWADLAVDPAGRHTLLAYQWRASWGLLYNAYMDRLLGLGVVAPAVYVRQSAWYAQVSQVFGVPLDSRHAYTKSDWLMWAAAVAAPATRRLLVTSLAYWLNHTTTDGPFADLFDVVGTGHYPQVPDAIRFRARPVVGGHFALLALAGRPGAAAGAAAGPASNGTGQ